MIKQIGEGSTAHVFQAQHKPTQKFYTCKRYPNKYAEIAQREAHILRHMDNIHLPHFHNLYSDSNFLYLFIDYIDGSDLYEFFVHQLRATISSERELKHIARQMLLCINACHKMRIQHLDIKLENFIVTNSNPVELKLIDFGQGQFFFNKCRTPLYNLAGTPGYSAPEYRNSEFTHTSDIWSYGICIWILATGEKPFNIDRKTKCRNYTFPSKKHMRKINNMPPLLRDIFYAIFQAKPEDRITMDQLIHHNWFDYP